MNAKFLMGALFVCSCIATVSCGKKTKLEACTFIEIEKPETEITLGDVDIERGEVEMVCDEKIIDVPWPEFKKQLNLNPEEFLGNIEGFRQQVTCLRDVNSKKKEVSCSAATDPNSYASLKFSYDD